MLGAFGLTYLCIILGIALLALPGMAFWIWAIIDCATKEEETGNTKVVWVLVIVLGHVLGALIYVLVRRPERRRLLGR